MAAMLPGIAARSRGRLLAALALSVALAGWAPAGQMSTGLCFAPRPGPVNPPPDAERVDQTAFSARDGSRLEGWWLRAPATAGRPRAVVLFAHGNGWNLERHWRRAARLADEGFDVLAFDYRGYGDSEGRATRAHARQDVLSAIEVARVHAREAGVPLVVIGQSMGAALAVEALAGRAERQGVVAVVADAPFTSWSEIAAWHLASGRATRASLQAALAALLWPTGEDPGAAAARLRVPLLVVGGDADDMTPGYMAREMAESAGAELLMLEGEGHPGNRSAEAEARVLAVEVAFIDRVLERNGPARP